MIDVVIVGYNQQPLEKCLYSVYEKSQGQAHVILVCNRPSMIWKLAYPVQLPVTIIDPKENVGWLEGANLGLKRAASPYVVLMNDDVEICTDGWIGKMISAFNLSLTLAAVGPSINGKHGGLQSWVETNKGPIIKTPELSLDGFGIGKMPLSFCCVMFSRMALTTVGLLDEQFSPGYGEDDDWQARAHLKGLQLGIQTDVQINHRSAGMDGKREQLQNRNVPRLCEKYRKILTEQAV